MPATFMDWPSFPKSDGFIATIASSFTSSLESDIVVVVVVARVFILGVLLFPRPTPNRTSPAKHKAHEVDEHEEAPGGWSFFTLNRQTKAAVRAEKL
jgi:hypothetical protein